jgi:hypothetical protein
MNAKTSPAEVFGFEHPLINPTRPLRDTSMREGRFVKARCGGPWLFLSPCLCRNLRPTSIRTRVSRFLARCTLGSIMQVGAAIYRSI